MKIKLFLAALSLAFCSVLAFGMAKKPANVHVTGIVEFYGNGPFARLGFKANDGTLYYLDAEAAVQKEIGALSGNFILVDGIVADQAPPVEMLNAAVLKVRKWKKL